MPKANTAKEPERTERAKRTLDELIADSARLRERALQLALEAQRLTADLRANANTPPSRRSATE